MAIHIWEKIGIAALLEECMTEANTVIQRDANLKTQQLQVRAMIDARGLNKKEFHGIFTDLYNDIGIDEEKHLRDVWFAEIHKAAQDARKEIMKENNDARFHERDVEIAKLYVSIQREILSKVAKMQSLDRHDLDQKKSYKKR